MARTVPPQTAVARSSHAFAAPREWLVPAEILNRCSAVDLGPESERPYPLPGETF